MRCHAAWVTTSKIPRDLIDKVISLWTSTTSGSLLHSLFDGEKKWFIRLDQMSPKDSLLGSNAPCTTLSQVIERICSSMRTYGCLTREKEDAEKRGRDVCMPLVVNKWDEGMDPGREFGCFVPPPGARQAGLIESTAEKGKEEMRMPVEFDISAISQYRWPFPFSPPLSGRGLLETAKYVLERSQGILSQILDFGSTLLSLQIRTQLTHFGFTFDVIVKTCGIVQLVEINPFGAMSGCGACSFNWTRDGRTLYGLSLEKGFVFAVTLAEGHGGAVGGGSG